VLEGDVDMDATDGLFASVAAKTTGDGGVSLSSSVALLTPEAIEILQTFSGTLGTASIINFSEFQTKVFEFVDSTLQIDLFLPRNLWCL